MTKKEDNRDIIMIAKPECLRCKHFYASNQKTFNCLNDKNCPAQTLKVVIGINIMETSDRYFKALSNNDVDELEVIHEELKNIDSHIKNKILTLAKTKLRGSNG